MSKEIRQQRRNPREAEHQVTPEQDQTTLREEVGEGKRSRKKTKTFNRGKLLLKMGSLESPLPCLPRRMHLLGLRKGSLTYPNPRIHLTYPGKRTHFIPTGLHEGKKRSEVHAAWQAHVHLEGTKETSRSDFCLPHSPNASVKCNYPAESFHISMKRKL